MAMFVSKQGGYHGQKFTHVSPWNRGTGSDPWLPNIPTSSEASAKAWNGIRGPRADLIGSRDPFNMLKKSFCKNEVCV